MTLEEVEADLAKKNADEPEEDFGKQAGRRK